MLNTYGAFAAFIHFLENHQNDGKCVLRIKGFHFSRSVRYIFFTSIGSRDTHRNKSRSSENASTVLKLPSFILHENPLPGSEAVIILTD
jgi:hypothetical protein